MVEGVPVSVVIPTYGRERVLVETIGHLLHQSPPATEIIVVDQTPQHEGETEKALATWAAEGQIRWLRLPKPSIPQAMNRGLAEATQPIVLFLDDDILPDEGLIGSHWRNYSDNRVWAVVGQVLQPGQVPEDLTMRGTQGGVWADLNFAFNSRQRTTVRNCIACNLSVRRDRAIAAGGFDENFVAVAYRFETEFARRLWRRGGIVQFDPAASINHLQAARGGTRTFGGHLRCASPVYSVGDYYFAFREAIGTQRFGYIVRRIVRSLWAKFYLTHPWWLLVRVVAECRGVLWALHLNRQGPRLLSSDSELEEVLEWPSVSPW